LISGRSLLLETVDIIKQLGALAFASRLRRLSEQLMKDVVGIYRQQAVDFRPRWFPVLYLLHQQSPLSVTDIAKKLGMTHPAINQIGGAMLRAGLISSHKDTKDERRRLLRLTEKGEEVVSELTPVWNDISSATAGLLNETGTDVLEHIARIESSLNKQGMKARVLARIKQRQYAEIEIIAYQSRFKRLFDVLNREWLEAYFRVEPPDEVILSNPKAQILEKGGHIFFARLNGDIIGTAALKKVNDTTYELIKMGVTEKARGRQAGKRLAIAAIEKAKVLGARTVILHTSPKLTIAEKLYRQLGFIDDNNIDDSAAEYDRCTIGMRLDVNHWKKSVIDNTEKSIGI